MSNKDEKLQFSERLQQALTEAKHPISPTYLSNEFNLRYIGQPISVQSANNWLLGKAIPSQDKLTILSLWLSVSSQWLRFGENEHSQPNLIDQLSVSEAEYFIKYSRLTSVQKTIIQNLIDEFSIH